MKLTSQFVQHGHQHSQHDTPAYRYAVLVMYVATEVARFIVSSLTVCRRQLNSPSPVPAGADASSGKGDADVQKGAPPTPPSASGRRGSGHVSGSWEGDCRPLSVAPPTPLHPAARGAARRAQPQRRACELCRNDAVTAAARARRGQVGGCGEGSAARWHPPSRKAAVARRGGRVPRQPGGVRVTPPPLRRQAVSAAARYRHRHCR